MVEALRGPNYLVPKVNYKSDIKVSYVYPGSKKYLLIVKGIGGVIWSFHLSDADPFPSNPHGDGVDQARKLDVFTGIIYDKKTMKPLKQLTCKEYKQLWSNKELIKLVKRIRRFERHERIDTYMNEPYHKCSQYNPFIVS